LSFSASPFHRLVNSFHETKREGLLIVGGREEVLRVRRVRKEAFDGKPTLMWK